MYPSREARELAILLRISRELDIVGDVTAIVDSPSEMLAWSSILDEATVAAWRAEDSGHRYLQVTADHARAPIRGRVAAVLQCEEHPHFWDALELGDVEPGQTVRLSGEKLSKAWAAMPVFGPGGDLQRPFPPSAPDS